MIVTHIAAKLVMSYKSFFSLSLRVFGILWSFEFMELNTMQIYAATNGNSTFTKK